MNFKEAAIKILKEAEKPLHYREITKRAIERELIETEGKTPWATMSAQFAVDIKKKGRRSVFIRTDPGFFGLNPNKTSKSSSRTKTSIVRHPVNEDLSTKQKGDIAEARVAELIMLYGDEGLSCYLPMSDDEGVDLIVKRRGKLDVSYIQVKSTFGYGERGFVSTVSEQSLVNKIRLLLVFVYFDLSEGDLYDHVFCIPAPEFKKLTKLTKARKRTFTVGLKNPDKSKYAEFMIEKRELANRIIEIMDRL